MMDQILTIWSMVRRYIVGAVVGGVMTVLAGIGITEVTAPEVLENLRIAVDALLMVIFYSVTIWVKTWSQKRVIERGGVLPERIESASTALDHGLPVQMR